MKNFFITLLAIISIVSVKSQNSTIWVYDWQNTLDSDADLSDCVPSSLEIAQNSSAPINVTYGYQFACTGNNTNNTYSELTVNTTTGAWMDIFGQQLVYNSTYNFIQFTRPNLTGEYLYSIGGQFFSLQFVSGSLYGTWNDPQPVNGSSTCCVPNELFIILNNGNTTVDLYYNTTCSANNQQIFNVYNSEVTTVNYNSTNTTINLALSPNVSTTQLEVNLTNGCVYTYTKVPATPLLDDTWTLDWQSVGYYPNDNYSISIQNSSFMMSYYLYGDTPTYGYVAQNPQGEYVDSAMDATFIFDNATNTLLDTTLPILYSTNGSILSFDGFINFWGTPELNNTNTTACCLPSYINITAFTTQHLSATYIFSADDANSISACNDLYIVNSSMETTMAIASPSTVQLTWIDEYGQISFANASDPSKIAMASSTQCNFTMIVTTPPTPPPPAPLSGEWISARVVALVMGIFIMMVSL